MTVRPGPTSPCAAGRWLAVGLALAGCAAAPPLAGAQQAGADDRTGPRASATGPYACVDPSDALARRRLQYEPCRLPLYELPRPEGPDFKEWSRLQPGPTGAPATDPGHAMFWRFPVQGRGPYEVPRHTWR